MSNATDKTVTIEFNPNSTSKQSDVIPGATPTKAGAMTAAQAAKLASLTPVGAGVTELTSGVGISLTPNPITETGVIGLADTAVAPGSYTKADITVDAQGRITAAANGSADGVTSITGGTGIVCTPNPIVGVGTVALGNTAVVPGSYTNASITVDQQGRITVASSGAAVVQSLQAAYNGGNTVQLAAATPVTLRNNAVNGTALRVRSSGDTADLLSLLGVDGLGGQVHSSGQLKTSSLAFLAQTTSGGFSVESATNITLFAGPGTLHGSYLSLGEAPSATGGDAQLFGGEADGAGDGGSVVVAGGAAVVGGSINGGAASFAGGQSLSAVGGAASVTGGSGGTVGGATTVTGGAGATTGGAATLRGGEGTTAPGVASVIGGAASSGNNPGAGVAITGGAGSGTTGAGGAVTITGGAGGVAAFSSFGGNVVINAGQGTADAGDINIGLLTTANIRIGSATQDIAFYGATPTPKQNLAAAPTAAQIATVLGNLGLVTLV